MILVDTSILVASSVLGHPRFTECSALLDRFTGQICCSTHSLAETYSVLTRAPRPMRLSGSEAFQVVEDLQRLLEVVSLTEEEYIQTLRRVADLGLTGGVVYDALHMACARKQQAVQVYTLNTSDFKRVAPDLAGIVLEP